MKLDLKRILAASEGTLPFSYDADLSNMEMYGSYPFKTPVHIEGEIRNHLDILKLTASIHALYETACSRCLAPVNVTLDVPCETILTREAQDEESDDLYLLEGDSVDVDDVVIPSLLLEVRMTYLCRPDCKGICPTCGKDLNEGTCSCGGKQIDSRMAVLQKLLDKQS
ncbi:MAG: YceD family protein [Butyricicoccus sp.]